MNKYSAWPASASFLKPMRTPLLWLWQDGMCYQQEALSMSLAHSRCSVVTVVDTSTQARHQRVDGRRGIGGLRWTLLLLASRCW